jgi:hypothetical protein
VTDDSDRLEMFPGFMRGKAPESWHCVDCGRNTAPGLFGRVDLERALIIACAAVGDDAGVPQTIDEESEVYTVTDKVWRRAGMEPWGGCLCIEHLEARIGRRLKPKDFDRDDPFNKMPGTDRLLSRREGRR